METNTYTILEEKREEIEKKLKRLQKKAQRYNVPLSVSYGEPYALEIKHKDDYGTTYTCKYEVFDLTIESDTIRKDGYTVIAHLEHSENGNIVNVFHGEMQDDWATIQPFCAHCNSNHNLKYTFMVSNGTETKQVGRTCLKEYCGIDPQMIGMMNQFAEEIDEYTADGYDFREPLICVYDCDQVLATAIEIIKEQGYIKSDEYKSNKSELIKKANENYRPSVEAVTEANKIINAVLNMSVKDAVEAGLNNVQTRFKGFYCKPSDFGYFAYAPVAFEKYEKRMEELKRRKEERNAMGAQSEYVGTIGERAIFDIKEVKLLTCFYNDYGMTSLYRFIDTNGNVLIWFCSGSFNSENVSKIKATVKNHAERDGIKQTILTRVKVA